MEYTLKEALAAGLDPMKMVARVDVEWVRTLPIQDGMRVLDVGVFKGRDLRQLWADHPNCQLTGVDSYRPAIDYCKAKHADIGAAWLVANAKKLPFKSKSFDVVYENGMLSDNLEEDRATIRAEMERVEKVVYYGRS